jgi:hypothetical protein
MVSVAVWIFAFAPFPELTECDYEYAIRGKDWQVVSSPDDHILPL